MMKKKKREVNNNNNIEENKIDIKEDICKSNQEDI